MFLLQYAIFIQFSASSDVHCDTVNTRLTQLAALRQHVACNIWNVKMYFISSPIEANMECQAILKTYELFIYGDTTLLIQFVKEVYWN
jgi:hypothetical protein